MFRPSSLPPAHVAAVARPRGQGAAGLGRCLAPRPVRFPVPGQVLLLGLILGVALGVFVSVGPAAPARAAAPAQDETPLSVTIESLTPSVVPKHGRVTVTGTVTNRDQSTWTDVSVYAFMGDHPLSSTELAEAASVPATTDVGGRIAVPGLYDEIPEIAPGASARFSLRVPRSALGVTAEGVYWFGVHALGTGPDGRIDGADGRARTFLPLVQGKHDPVDTAVVLPLRRGVTYAADGSIAHPERWMTDLSTSGRLRSVVDFGAAAGSRPITWLLDPGVPDAVRALAQGNPPRPLAAPASGSTDGSGEGDGGSGEPSPTDGADQSSDQPTTSSSPDTPDPASGSSSAGDSGSGGSSGGASSSELAALAESGNAWLDRLHEALDGSEVLALPYGDVDVAAAAEHDPRMYEQARHRSGKQLDPWGLPMSPAVAPLSGYLDREGIEATSRRTTVLLSDRASGADADPAVPTVLRAGRHRVVTTSSGVASGGPGPDDPLGAVAVRQRILAEAAQRVLAGDSPRPLVARLPTRWRPSGGTGFFAGLDVDWLHLTSLADVATDPVPSAGHVAADDLAYPDPVARRQLPSENFSAAASLVRAGNTLQRVLSENDHVAGVVADQAFHEVGAANRARPQHALVETERSRSWIEHELRSITISAPPAVTLSSASGRFAATLTNGLDEPVVVSIKALTDEPRAVTGPEQVEIGPGSSTSVLLKASTRQPGVHNVTLVVTDSQGIPLGSSDQLPIRSARVSNVIWGILGTGVALLFAAIALRLVRRVRAARRPTSEESR